VSEHIQRYAPPEDVLRFAQENNWPTIKIVRAVSGALPRAEALKVAREWAPLLDLTVAEFMKLRKNE
jgi:hypothetical protein